MKTITHLRQIPVIVHEPPSLCFRQVLGTVDEGIGEGRSVEVGVSLNGASIVLSVKDPKKHSGRTYIIQCGDLVRAVLDKEGNDADLRLP